MRLKAFASYRSSWQFAPLGEVFGMLYRKHKTAFAAALRELALPAQFFDTKYRDKVLPGVFLKNSKQGAPVVLVIGGSDTCFEDLFLTVGRNLFERSYSVALVDLPGQGILPADGRFWEVEAEKSITAVVDVVVEHFGAEPGRIALLGLSLGGYFVTRAAGHESRFATVMASTPFSNPGEMFRLVVCAAEGSGAVPAPNSAALRSRQIVMWRAGARSPQELVERTTGMIADPALVTVPFLSILGGGDSPVFAAQAEAWHASIRSKRKEFVRLDEATGADWHCQVNNRLRLAQEVCGWLGKIFV
jgi:pimeloyl-ACP methyl ester carboxylesterase